MAHEMIIAEVHGRVGVIKYNRPERMNALDPVMSRERYDQMAEWNADPNIGAIVITGEGRAFCAGADVGGWKKDIVERGGTRQKPAGQPIQGGNSSQSLRMNYCEAPGC